MAGQEFQEDVESGTDYSFPISAEKLSEMFDPDNLRDKHSMQKLTELGGLDLLLSKLRTSCTNGIRADDEEHLERMRVYGLNAPISKTRKSLMSMICEQFDDEVLRILLVAATVSLVIGVWSDGWGSGWIEGTAILLACFIVVFVTAGNDYVKEQQFIRLYERAEDRYITVRRESRTRQIKVFDLLVGDILHLSQGDKIPVDGILVEGHGISVDESSVTGEDHVIYKTVNLGMMEHCDPFLISGTQIMEGHGIMLVCAVGKLTQEGKSKMRLQEAEQDSTPLQDKLEVLAGDIGKAGFGVASVTVIALIINLMVHKISTGDELFDSETLNEIAQYIIVGITIIVVAVPEGLPLAVTLSLAFSVGKMKEENNLVRHLNACETMGGGNVICSDKTGTLTQNRMKVEKLYCEEQIFHKLPETAISHKTLELLFENICINSTAFLDLDEDTGIFNQIGNKTECAMLELAEKFSYRYEDEREKADIVHSYPFSPLHKTMTTIEKRGDNAYIFVKGAAEILLDKCKYYIDKTGHVSDIGKDDMNDSLSGVVNSFAKESLRCISIAYKKVPISKFYPQKPSGGTDTKRPNFDRSKSSDCQNLNAEFLDQEDFCLSDLTLLSIIGIKDPLRPESYEAVKACERASISVLMVTGDNVGTATSIAKECGILSFDFDPKHQYTPYTVMEGKKFREEVGGFFKDEKTGEIRVSNIKKFEEIKHELRVLARSTPDDKFLLVTGLRQLGDIVAVTGDGTNDAPALKRADVGFAMGIEGTEVAKDAADIIILDDNFNSIVTSIKWGRNVYDCIRKFLQFQLTVNLVAMFMAFLGAVVLRESPLTSVQMLWVNLIMDTLGSLALATEPPSEDILSRKPIGRDVYLITKTMKINIATQGFYQIIILCAILFYGDEIFNVPSSIRIHVNDWTYENAQHYTIFFNTFVFMQVFNEVNARKLKLDEFNIFKNFFNNFLFLLIQGLTIAVQILLVQYGGIAMRCAPLSVEQHLVCIAIGFGSIIVGFFVKLSYVIGQEIFLNKKNLRPQRAVRKYSKEIRSEIEMLVDDEECGPSHSLTYRGSDKKRVYKALDL